MVDRESRFDPDDSATIRYRAQVERTIKRHRVALTMFAAVIGPELEDQPLPPLEEFLDYPHWEAADRLGRDFVEKNLAFAKGLGPGDVPVDVLYGRAVRAGLISWEDFVAAKNATPEHYDEAAEAVLALVFPESDAGSASMAA
jgi:hypothetical protein